MFPPFPQEAARKYCCELIAAINEGSVNLVQISQESEERKNQGIMVGCLVCKNKITDEQTVLFALSGYAKELSVQKIKLSDCEGFVVPSLVSSSQIAGAISKNDLLIHQLTEQINLLRCSKKNPEELAELELKRKSLCDESLRNVFSLYEFTRFDGKKISLNEIICKRGNVLPPTGTGDCCAPKLLCYAFANNLIPLSMDEIFFGNSTKNKESGCSYPPCDERCGFILPEILGLEILYRDESIVIVNKQSGLLSVPGRGEDKQDCIVTRLKRLFPDCIEQPSVHRLDMETSGLLILAFTKEAHRAMNMQFEKGTVHKKYVALLDGILERSSGMMAPKNGQTEGVMELKFRLDVDNRPHQIYDEVYGKNGITEWKKDGTVVYENPANGERKHVTKVIFIPHTGRTHQLRLASSDSHGFGLPIIGDTLYGTCSEGQRLMLHAFEIEFDHPVTGQKMHFECKSPF